MQRACRSNRANEVLRVRRMRGLSLLEVLIAVTVFLVALIPLGQLVRGSSEAFSSLAGRTHIATRGQVIMDRLIDELSSGRFVSMTPPVPNNSDWMRFQQIVDVVGGVPVYSDPIHIELVPLESNMNDASDNDGDGLVNEGGVRIWTDVAPYDTTPGPEDTPVMIADNVASNGLVFTRNGAVLLVQLTLQAATEAGQPPTLVTLTSGAKMRNN